MKSLWLKYLSVLFSANILLLNCSFASNDSISNLTSNFRKQVQNTFIENKGQWNNDVLFIAKHQNGVIVIYKDGFDLVRIDAENEKQNIENSIKFLDSKLAQIERKNKSEFKTNYIRKDNSFLDISSYQEIVFKNIYHDIDLRYHFSNYKLEYDFIVHNKADLSKIRINSSSPTSINSAGQLQLITTTGANIAHSAPIAWHEDLKFNKNLANAKFKQLSKNDFGFEIEKAKSSANSKLVIDPEVNWGEYIGGSPYTTHNDYIRAIKIDQINGDVYLAGHTLELSGFSDVFIAKYNKEGGFINLTILGGSNNDYPGGLAVDLDGSGSLTIAGNTASTDFPVVNAFSWSNSGFRDIFVTRLAPNLTTIWYSTYIGGQDQDVVGLGVESSTFGPNDPANSINTGMRQSANGLVVDSLDRIYVAGTMTTFSGSTSACSTITNSFPLTVNPYDAFFQSTGNSVDSEGLFFVIDPNITNPIPGNNNTLSLLYSTLVGGRYRDGLSSIAISQTNYPGTSFPLVTLAGITKARPTSGCPGGTNPCGVQYPITANAMIPIVCSASPNRIEGVVTQLAVTPGPSALVYSTYIGGQENDLINDVKVDNLGNVYVVGTSDGPASATAVPPYGFPITANAYDPTYNGGVADAFLVKFNPSLPATSQLIYGTWLGGSQRDFASSVTVDPSGIVTVVGSTSSPIASTPPFPSIGASMQSTSSDNWLDGFLTRFSRNGASLLYSGHYGGNNYSVLALDHDSGLQDQQVVAGYVSGSGIENIIPNLFTNSYSADDEGYVLSYDNLPLPGLSRFGSATSACNYTPKIWANSEAFSGNQNFSVVGTGFPAYATVLLLLGSAPAGGSMPLLNATLYVDISLPPPTFNLFSFYADNNGNLKINLPLPSGLAGAGPLVSQMVSSCASQLIATNAMVATFTAP